MWLDRVLAGGALLGDLSWGLACPVHGCGLLGRVWILPLHRFPGAPGSRPNFRSATTLLTEVSQALPDLGAKRVEACNWDILEESMFPRPDHFIEVRNQLSFSGLETPPDAPNCPLHLAHRFLSLSLSLELLGVLLAQPSVLSVLVRHSYPHTTVEQPFGFPAVHWVVVQDYFQVGCWWRESEKAAVEGFPPVPTHPFACIGIDPEICEWRAPLAGSVRAEGCFGSWRRFVDRLALQRDFNRTFFGRWGELGAFQRFRTHRDILKLAAPWCIFQIEACL